VECDETRGEWAAYAIRFGDASEKYLNGDISQEHGFSARNAATA